ncbi:MAG: phenylacetate--CoA ligase family protein [Clostridia bacterium]|nr:phenylacetate--CoA ligase family protein [Clostridia bacterium]
MDDVFPVVNKQLLSGNKKFLAREGFLTPIHISSTSGSTGTPFSVAQDYKKRKRNIADLQVFGERCDYPPRERMVFFRVLSDKLKRTAEQEDSENIYYIDSSYLDDLHLENMYQVLLEKKPRIIFSYASTLVELAKYILRAHSSSNERSFSMKSVLTAGEGLSEENRSILKKAFKCKVYRRYSDMELGILGQDQGDGGSYRLNWGSYYFEVLKLDSDEPASYGEVGRIVITDLFNYAFPLIRYDTGDLGVLDKIQGESFPVLKEIYGRVRDCLWDIKGRLVSPAKISVQMWGVKGVKQWQCIQKSQYVYVMKLNVEKIVDIDCIRNRMRAILGDLADIQFEFVDEIPVLSSNKRRAVICEWKK